MTNITRVRRRSCEPLALLVLLLVLTTTLCGLSGCSESTAPASSARDGGAIFEGRYQASAESFLLDRLAIHVPGQEPVVIELRGSNLWTDSRTESVGLDVAIRNAGHLPLHPPGMVWISDLRPSSVHVRNPDAVRDSTVSPTGPSFPVAYGFNYSDLLGNDRVLQPGEESVAKPWVFGDPGLVSFAFAARARFSLVPDRPLLSGATFVDDNRNGLRDPDEPPFQVVEVVLHQPDGANMSTRPNADGYFSFPLTLVGLHSLRFNVELDVPIPVCETTPNPLEILIVPGPDGDPLGFDGADFGVAFIDCARSDVLLTELRPDEIPQDPYDLVRAELRDNRLVLQVGFSGCSPDHPFALYAGLPFMESFPVATWVLLAHNDLGELCDAAFERTLHFDLTALQDEYFRQYGRRDPIRLLFRDFNGVVQQLLLQP